MEMGALWAKNLFEVPVKALFKGLSCKLAPRRGVEPLLPG